MAEVDRRGFFRILRRTDTAAAEPADPGAPSEKDLQVGQLADLTLRLLADVDAENDERLAEGTLMTVPCDLVYMRVTADHIAFSIETGFSTVVNTKDVRAFDTERAAEMTGYGPLLHGVLRAHHPADPEHVTRSFAFRFREDSPLVAAIRTACDLPEPEEPPAEEGAATGPEPEPTGGPRP